MKPSERAVKAWVDSSLDTHSGLAEIIARETRCDEKLKQGGWNVEKISPSDKPSERAAKRLQTSGFADRRSSTEIIASIIAEQTKCDEGCEEPKVPLWQQANPTPWKLNRLPRREGRDIFPKVEIRANDGGIVMPLVDEGSIAGDTYAYIVDCVNREVEQAEVPAELEDAFALHDRGFPWRIIRSGKGCERIVMAGGTPVSEWVVSHDCQATVLRYLVAHMNRLKRKACPKATGGV